MWWIENCQTIVLWQHHLFGHISHKWSMVCHFSYISFILTRFIIVEKWAPGRCATYNRTLNREQELILKTKSWPITISSQFSEARSAVVQVHMASQKYFFRWNDYKELNFSEPGRRETRTTFTTSTLTLERQLGWGKRWIFQSQQISLALLPLPSLPILGRCSVRRKSS